MICADFSRRLILEGRPANLWHQLCILPRPGVSAILLFRLNHYFHDHGLRRLSKIINIMMLCWSGDEIHPGARIGPGLVLPDIGGVGIPAFADIGCDCTFTGPALLTIGGMEGIDLTKDRIVLGDHCVIGPGVRIVGAVTLADGTQVKPNAVVITSFLNAGTLLSGIPSRRRGTIPIEKIRRWNPILGQSTSQTSVQPQPEPIRPQD
ncbi:MAG: serine O-acetyltransferase [Acidiferrobacteraceae bacterium]